MVAKPQHQIKLQAYGQAGMASNTYKDPEKDRVAVAGETRKAKAASKFIAIKSYEWKINTLRMVILLYTLR